MWELEACHYTYQQGLACQAQYVGGQLHQSLAITSVIEHCELQKILAQSLWRLSRLQQAKGCTVAHGELSLR